MITRRSLADCVDELDNQIAELQTEKAEVFTAYRQQLDGQGRDKGQIKVEIAAAKVAIRKRRKLAEDPSLVEEQDVLVDEILSEIQQPIKAGTRSATRTRTRVRVSQPTMEAANEANEDTSPQTAGGGSDNASPPATDLPHVDTSDRPFGLPDDGIPDALRRARV